MNTTGAIAGCAKFVAHPVVEQTITAAVAPILPWLILGAVGYVVVEAIGEAISE